ncbi:MAG: radical SAM protein [Lachnospiraceae bacterium]|nr:radical SAM protein [Lachnospiraceae bacterium]
MSSLTLRQCNLCPRGCGVDRTQKPGVCGCKDTMRVARAALHMWEEPCISGKKGSGAVFFAGCALHCVFCQNAAISGGDTGRAYTSEELAAEMIRLQGEGAANINLVTAGQWATGVHETIAIAKERGLTIPIVWNSGGYESVETLALLRDDIDIYLPDYKYRDAGLAASFSHAKDYPEVAAKAIARMVEAAGEPVFDEDGYMTRGVIVRVLVLPGHRDDACEVISYLHETYGDRIYISIMNQYTPPKKPLPYPELNRRLTRYEYEKVVGFARSLPVENGFIQVGATASESFIPEFSTTE